MSRHRDGIWAAANQLLLAGHDVATEVGVRGGRVDVAVVDSGRLVWLLEVKTARHELGISQLHRYAAAVGGNPRLTLVAEPGAAPSWIFPAASAIGVDVWELRFATGRRHPRSSESGRLVSLPGVHPDTTDATRALLRAWARENAAPRVAA